MSPAMPRPLAALIGFVLGYPAGAAAGWGLVEMLSSNTHDRGMEAAMTAIFVTGPAGAVLGAVAAAVMAGRRRRPPAD